MDTSPNTKNGDRSASREDPFSEKIDQDRRGDQDQAGNES